MLYNTKFVSLITYFQLMSSCFAFFVKSYKKNTNIFREISAMATGFLLGKLLEIICVDFFYEIQLSFSKSIIHNIALIQKNIYLFKK